MIRGVQAQGRLREGVLAQFWHRYSPNGDGRDSEPSGSALFLRKLWSHPPGLNRRPTDYESQNGHYWNQALERTCAFYMSALRLASSTFSYASFRMFFAPSRQRGAKVKRLPKARSIPIVVPECQR